MKVELTLSKVPQNREMMIIHEIKSIAPRLSSDSHKGTLKFSGTSTQEELNEIMDFVYQYHPGDHSLHTRN